MLPEILIDTIPNLTETFSERLEEASVRAFEARGHFSFAVAGGSVGTALFPRLAESQLDWSRTDLFWADERAVPPSHPDSNYGLARTLWLDPAHVPREHVHRMAGEAEDLGRAADHYARELARLVGTPIRLDVILLGAGSDGHVCSLFPGHSALLEGAKLVTVVEDAPMPPPRRLTLTLPALASARLLVVAAFGDSKARAIQEALEQPHSSLPLALVLRRAPRALVLLDPAAAGAAGNSQCARDQ